MWQLIHANLVENQCFWVRSVLPTQRMIRKEMCQCLLSWQAVNTRDSDGERRLMWINSTQCMRLKQIHLKHHWTKALKRVSVKTGTHRRAVISGKTDREHPAKPHVGRNQVCSCVFTDTHLGAGEMARWVRALDALPEVLGHFPAPTWWPTTNSNSSSRRSDALFWYIASNTYTYRNKNDKSRRGNILWGGEVTENNSMEWFQRTLNSKTHGTLSAQHLLPTTT